VKKIVFLLALIILLKPVLPVIEYAVNYNYIATILCENKDKPKMHCNGKCHLMKELAKASENDKPISQEKKVASQESEVLFFEEIKSFRTASIYLDHYLKTNNNYSNFYFFLNSVSVLKPPINIS
jgi:hypothetical protein